MIAALAQPLPSCTRILASCCCRLLLTPAWCRTVSCRWNSGEVYPGKITSVNIDNNTAHVECETAPAAFGRPC
jgi:hypothetical protein